MRFRSRLKWFFRYQRLSWRRLLSWRGTGSATPLTIEPLPGSIHPLYAHPSTTCKCEEKIGHLDPLLHLPECEWGKVMCRTCRGMGWCPECGGDGVDPTTHPLTPSAVAPGLVTSATGDDHSTHCRFVAHDAKICIFCGFASDSHCEICAAEPEQQT